MPITCDLCGTTADGDDVPLTWSTSVEGAGERQALRRYCERCTRENVRAMEGKLDRDFW